MVHRRRIPDPAVWGDGGGALAEKQLVKTFPNTFTNVPSFLSIVKAYTKSSLEAVAFPWGKTPLLDLNEVKTKFTLGQKLLVQHALLHGLGNG